MRSFKSFTIDTLQYAAFIFGFLASFTALALLFVLLFSISTTIGAIALVAFSSIAIGAMLSWQDNYW